MTWSLIGSMLPAVVASCESRGGFTTAPLHPLEADLVSRSVPKRQAEFSEGRSCAHSALAALGVTATWPLLADDRGAPCWPEGVVGSITHCEGYCAAAVARRADLASIGIDAEPHRPLGASVFEHVTSEQERSMVRRLLGDEDHTRWDLLCFSAKEAVYKAWYPLTHRPLGFRQVCLSIDAVAQRFEAALLVPGAVLGQDRVTTFRGSWIAVDGILVSAVTVPAAPPAGDPDHLEAQLSLP